MDILIKLRWWGLIKGLGRVGVFASWDTSHHSAGRIYLAQYSQAVYWQRVENTTLGGSISTVKINPLLQGPCLMTLYSSNCCVLCDRDISQCSMCPCGFDILKSFNSATVAAIVWMGCLANFAETTETWLLTYSFDRWNLPADIVERGSNVGQLWRLSIPVSQNIRRLYRIDSRNLKLNYVKQWVIHWFLFCLV